MVHPTVAKGDTGIKNKETSQGKDKEGAAKTSEWHCPTIIDNNGLSVAIKIKEAEAGYFRIDLPDAKNYKKINGVNGSDE